MVLYYKSLSLKWRLLITMGFLAVILTSAALIATAAIDPASVFDNQTPADGSTVPSATPTVSVSINNSGSLDMSTAAMTLNEGAVSAQLSGTGSDYTLSYTPGSALADGLHSVSATIYETSVGYIHTSWSFTIGAGPVLGSFTPTPGTVNSTNSPTISFTAADSSEINGASAQIKVNGQSLPVTIKYKEIGHYEKQLDSCSDTYTEVWVVDGYDYTEATISASSSGLPDTNNVWVSVADKLGNTSTWQWSFTTATAPVISNLTPANKSVINIAQPVISATVTDNGTVDVQSIIMKLGTTQVNHSFNSSTRVVSYTPPSTLAEGTYNVYLEAKDALGNKSSASWSFQVLYDYTAPTLSSISPTEGSILSTSSPAISFKAYDAGWLNGSTVQVKVNGKSLPVTITWKQAGYWMTVSDSCTGESFEDVWVVTGNDYTEATISAATSNIPDEVVAWVSVADRVGNVSTKQWAFWAMQAPVISNLTPANGSSLNTHPWPKISATISDNGTIDKSSIIFKLDGQTVSHTYTATSGSSASISYTPSEPLVGGRHDVYLEVKDTTGNVSTSSWYFNVGTSSAGFSSETPANGTPTGKYNPTVSVFVQDVASINSSHVYMRINGQPVRPTFNYLVVGGHWETITDTCGTFQYWVKDYDYTKGTVTYTPSRLPDGPYTVHVSVANNNGNISIFKWNFDVLVPLKLSQLNPYPQSIIKTTTPTVSALVTHNGSGITSSKILIDGVEIPSSFDPVTNIVSGTPVSPIENYNPDHKVQLMVSNGVNTSTGWNFFSKSCSECHTDQPAAHPMGNCNLCHEGPVDECASCHGNYVHDYTRLVSAWNHGGHWEPQCTLCHGPGSQSQWNIPYHPADNNTYHNTSTAFDPCQSCHALSLVREHGQRTDPATNTNYDCNTCHKSTVAEVGYAINNTQKNCDACHTAADSSGHRSMHETTNLDTKCTTCHKNNLFDEHLENPTTQTTALTCGTCHDAPADTNPNVYGAIATENMQCAACHRQGHNVNFAEKLPVDIPLYNGFNWSVPDDARLWAGESWLPDEFLVGGRVVISNRRTDVIGDDVWNFFNTEMTANGWTLFSTAPATGSDFYSATFTKGTHKAILWFYGGVSHTASPVVPGGYRIKIIYK